MLEKIISNSMESLENRIDYNNEYSKIYKFHKYWARKPWYSVNEFIKKYSKEGENILDPFCGSGSTGLESIILNRNFVGIDLNPIAIKVSEGTMNSNIDINKLLIEFEKIKEISFNEISVLYSSTELCKKCNGHLFFKNYYIGPKFKNVLKGQLYCPYCNVRIPNNIKYLNEEEVEYYNKYKNINSKYWFPRNRFPEKFYKDRFTYKGIKFVSDMFTKRNLYSLSTLLHNIKSLNLEYEELFYLVFSNTLLHCSKLKGVNIRPLGVNNYWIPDDYIEENVWFRFEERFSSLIKSKTLLKKRVEGKKIGEYTLINASSLKMDYKESFDYIFTDPPYGETIQYSELSFLWNSWLNSEYYIEDEVIINPVQNKDKDVYMNMLEKSLKKIYLALKNERYFTLCFQNKDFNIWKDIISYCKKIGFVLYDIGVYDTFGQSYNNNWSNFSPKADIYVTFKKTDSSILDNYSNNLSLYNMIEKIYVTYLNKNSSIDINKLYDLTVSVLIWDMYYNLDFNHKLEFNSMLFAKLIEEIVEKNKNNKEREYEQLKLDL